jgi:hypothetical protein
MLLIKERTTLSTDAFVDEDEVMVNVQPDDLCIEFGRTMFCSRKLLLNRRDGLPGLTKDFDDAARRSSVPQFRSARP